MKHKHIWFINSFDQGVCTIPGCGATHDFRKDNIKVFPADYENDNRFKMDDALWNNDYYWQGSLRPVGKVSRI